MRLSRLVPLVVLLLFAAGAIIYSESLKTRAQVGAPIPAFELVDLEGNRWRVSRPLEAPLVINFWASWCEPCLLEMPAHDAFYRRYGDRVGYVAINEREPAVRIREHLEQEAAKGIGFAFPILLDRDGSVGEAFRLGGMPETWFIDAQGVARFHWLGPVTFEMLQAAYWQATGTPIDALDGGPFHGSGTARAVLIGETPDVVYVGGSGGLARYRLAGGGAEARAFTWEPVDGDVVHGLLRGPDGRPVAITDKGVPGLPGTPGALAEGHGYRLAWVAGYGLFRAVGGGGVTDRAAPAAPADGADVWEGQPPGEQWRRMEPGIDGAHRVVALAADPAVPDRWLAATAGGLLESRDGGVTWRSLDVEPRVYAVAFDPVTPHRVYLATDTGVWMSEDGGRRPARVGSSPQRVLVALDAVALPDGLWLVAAAPNGDLYGSRDGREWSLLVPRRTS